MPNQRFPSIGLCPRVHPLKGSLRFHEALTDHAQRRARRILDVGVNKIALDGGPHGNGDHAAADEPGAKEKQHGAETERHVAAADSPIDEGRVDAVDEPFEGVARPLL